ncbi:unnamed protein product [Pedinophyceae sp. YPF-701]|nr:unnamed protein product [Pedinophyceae sp. YPF-701]
MVQILSLPVTLPSLTASGMGAAGAAAVLAAAGAATALGKLGHSMFSERIPAKAALCGILLLSAAANAGLGVALSASSSPATVVATIAACVAAGRLVTAGAWLAGTRLIKAWVPPERHGTAIGSLGFASRIGVVVSSLVLGALLVAGVTPDQLFVIVGIAGVAASGLLWTTLPDQRPQGAAAASPAGARHPAKAPPRKRESTPEALSRFASNPRVWLMATARCCYQLIFELQTLGPLLLTSALALAPGEAAQASAFFSLGAGGAVLAGGRVFSALCCKGRTALLVALAGACALALLALEVSLGLAPSYGGTAGGFGGHGHLVPLCLVVAGAAGATPYYVGVSSFTMRVGATRAPLLEGLSETLAYVAAVAFDWRAGELAGSGACEPVLRALFFSAVVAALCVPALTWRLRPERATA